MKIVDYQTVLQTLTSCGFRCNYPNSGSFGFEDMAKVQVRGWIGPPDSTIRQDLIDRIRHVPPPFERELAQAAGRVLDSFPGELIWLMPASHWGFELQHGSRAWLPQLLTQIGIIPSDLSTRNDGSAIEFGPSERQSFARCLEELLEHLIGSDFVFVLPTLQTICTVHHHKQLWWVTRDARLLGALDKVIGNT